MDVEFRIVPSSHEGFDYFAFHGNIGVQAKAQLGELPDLIKRPVVKFDFSGAGRINSFGIALLLRCFKTIKEDKRAEIHLLELNSMNALLFKMTGVLLLAEQA